MRKCVFRATITGEDMVRRTGPIRVPTSFRIRIYDDGEAVITTRGKIDVRSMKKVGGDQRMSEYSFDAISERLSKLDGVTRPKS